MYSTLKSTARHFLDFILPLRCPISGELVDHHGALSPEVWNGLEFIETPYCKRCSQPFSYETDEPENLFCGSCIQNPPHFDIACARLRYNDMSRTLLLKYKHGDQLHLARNFLPFLEQAATSFIDKVDIIAPVPLHPHRLLKRRYNQAAILAQKLASKKNLPYMPELLLRQKKDS